ncbi:MAG: MarR family transcriptional regulator [Tissierellia bacterium]|nr:MarR family transcriptional regulator [Tissierellia bacterium]
MDYLELANQFLHYMHIFKGYGHQKKIDETMQGETFVLLYIMRKRRMVLPSEISNEMNISSARVAAILNTLENKGFITRQIDQSDRRQILVDLTVAGKEVAEAHHKKVVSGTAKMLEFLGENDSGELVRIMGKLAEIAPMLKEDINSGRK